MILTPHIIVGATIGAKTQNLGLIVILALITHLIMDKIPHYDYDLPAVFREFRKNKKIKPLLSDFVKMAIDVTVGLSLTFVVLWYKNFLSFDYLPFILFGIFISILPDIILGCSFLLLSEKMAKKIFNFNHRIFHYKHKEKEGKITFLGLATEILVIIICVFLLSL